MFGCVTRGRTYLGELEEFPALPLELIHTEDGVEQTNPTWIFRGHSDCKWQLWPSLERLDPQLDWEAAEGDLLRNFQAKARLYADDVPGDGQRVEWLGLMQHHGLPTRLLDFTYSPFVATYFALREAEPRTGYAEILGA